MMTSCVLSRTELSTSLKAVWFLIGSLDYSGCCDGPLKGWVTRGSMGSFLLQSPEFREEVHIFTFSGVKTGVGSCLKCEAVAEELEWALPACAEQLSTVVVVADSVLDKLDTLTISKINLLLVLTRRSESGPRSRGCSRNVSPTSLCILLCGERTFFLRK